jgi:hypothetical protein
MATPEVTTRPSPAQGRNVSDTSTNREAQCTYCRRPIRKRVLAARKAYCGKLCAALGLIAEANLEDGIDDSFGSMEALLDSVFYDGPVKYPVKVRYSDAEGFASSDGNAVIVVIEDDGTPDWIPDPILDANQNEIDYAVEKMLAQAQKGGEEAGR